MPAICMPQSKKEHPRKKSRLHPRNKNRERYDFKMLTEASPELASFVKLNIHNDESVDFADPEAVKALNRAILKHHYGIQSWDIPPKYLCPPIPGRADYIHHISDLLSRSNFGKIPTGPGIKCLDVGVGANCIYPIIGENEYGWSFIGSDIDPIAIESANSIISSNPSLKDKVECRLQADPKDFFYSILRKGEIIDLSICNPPFHSSLDEAREGTMRKLKNLNKTRGTEADRNFGGQKKELVYKGGEERFVGNMIRQSKKFSNSCFWFSSLIAKQAHLKNMYKALRQADAFEFETIPMGQGSKSSRILAWTFLSKKEQLEWKKSRWKDS